MSNQGFIKRHPIATFFAITFIFTWVSISVILVSFPLGTNPAEMPPSFLMLTLIAGFGPSIAGVIVLRGVGKKGSMRARLKQWRVHIGWYAVALLVLPLVTTITLVIDMVLGIPVTTLERMSGVLAIGIIWGVLAAIGEEFGWRGYLLPTLQSQRSALFASIIIGISWGLWHLPMDIFGIGHYGLPLFISNFLVTHAIHVTAVSILMTWIYNNTNESLLMMVLVHFSATFTAILFATAEMAPVDALLHGLINSALLWIIVVIVIGKFGGEQLSKKPLKQ